MATTTETATRSASSPELGFGAGLARRNAVRRLKRAPGCPDFSAYTTGMYTTGMGTTAAATNTTTTSTCTTHAPLGLVSRAGTLADDAAAGALGMCAVAVVTLIYLLRVAVALLTVLSPVAGHRVGRSGKAGKVSGAAVQAHPGSAMASVRVAHVRGQSSPPLHSRPSPRTGAGEKAAATATATAATAAANAAFWSRALTVGFVLATGSRLCHAWGVFARFGGVWPAGGVPEYIEQANVQQNMVTLHVSAATLWAILLGVQMATGGGGTDPRRRRLHTIIGYTGIAAAGVTAVTGRLAISTLRIPSTSLVFIATQLRFGAPAFFVEAVLGVIAVARDKNLPKHRQHMRLAMFGTLADAGTGFSIAVSRALFAGTPHQIWAQDVGVLALNFLSILPFVLPGIGPHTDHVLARDWGKVLRNPQAEFGVWDYAAVVTVVGSFALLASNGIGLWLLFTAQ